MKTYTIISPSIDGILSDDCLYFEGISRPSVVYKLRDGEIPLDDAHLLEKYYNDIYNLLLRKLSSFTVLEVMDEEEELKMVALLQELIKVRKMIANTYNGNEV